MLSSVTMRNRAIVGHRESLVPSNYASQHVFGRLYVINWYGDFVSGWLSAMPGRQTCACES